MCPARGWAPRAQTGSGTVRSGSCSHSSGGTRCINRGTHGPSLSQGTLRACSTKTGREACWPTSAPRNLSSKPGKHDAVGTPNEVPWGPSQNWISGPKGIHLDISKYPPGCGLGLWPSQTPSHGRHTRSYPLLLSGLIRNFIFILQAPLTLSCP